MGIFLATLFLRKIIIHLYQKKEMIYSMLKSFDFKRKMN